MYINIAGILFLIVTSAIIYIYLGTRLRAAGKDALLQERAVEHLKAEPIVNTSDTPPLNNTSTSATPKIAPEVIPIPENDLKIIQSIFGIDTFFATETISYQEGAIFRGNLRGESDTVHQRLTQKLTEQFAQKYRLFLVEGTESKPVVIILPSTDDPQASTLAQKNLALVLLIATIVTSLEASGILLGFDLFENWQRIKEVIPLSIGLWTVLIAHEIGHRILAKNTIFV